MWNKIKTDEFEGMIAESVVINGCDQDPIHVYYARPMGPGPYPGIVLIPHMPGWDEWCRETARRFAENEETVVTATGTQHLLKDVPVQTEVISGRTTPRIRSNRTRLLASALEHLL